MCCHCNKPGSCQGTDAAEARACNQQECSPEQIKECHGEVHKHTCTPTERSE